MYIKYFEFHRRMNIYHRLIPHSRLLTSVDLLVHRRTAGCLSNIVRFNYGPIQLKMVKNRFRNMKLIVAFDLTARTRCTYSKCRMAAVRPVNPQWCLPLVQRLAYVCFEVKKYKFKKKKQKTLVSWWIRSVVGLLTHIIIE